MRQPYVQDDAGGRFDAVFDREPREEVHQAIGDFRVGQIFHRRRGIDEPIVEDFRDVHRERRVAGEQREKVVRFGGAEEALFQTHGVRRARLVVEKRLFPENVARAENRDGDFFAVGRSTRQAYFPALDEIDDPSRVALIENERLLRKDAGLENVLAVFDGIVARACEQPILPQIPDFVFHARPSLPDGCGFGIVSELSVRLQCERVQHAASIPRGGARCV